MDRRTFLTRGAAALAATALAAVLPRQAAAVPAAPPAPLPPLLHRYRDAYGVERLEMVPEAPRSGLTLMQTAIRRGGVPTDAEQATVAMFTNDSPVIHILGGEVKVDRFVMDDYVPQPRTLYLNPTLLAQAKSAYGDSFYGVPLASTDVGYPPQSAMLHWKGRAASGDARLQGAARRRLLRSR